MTSLLLYLAMVTLWWLVTWMMSHRLLKSEGRPGERRLFLLTGLIAAVIAPLIPWSEAIPEAGVYLLPEIRIGDAVAPPLSAGHAPVPGLPHLLYLLLLVYGAGLLWHLSDWVRTLNQLRRLARIAERQWIDGDEILLVPGLSSPFQFAGRIYIPASLGGDPEGFAMAVAHERAHKHMLHTLDLLVGQLIRVAFWFHPLPKLLLRQLRLIHEYQADERVIRMVDRDEYVRFLGGFRSRMAAHPTWNTLQQGPLKHRIMHMYRPFSSWGVRHRAAIFLALVGLIGLSAFVRPGRLDQTLESISPSLGLEVLASEIIATPRTGPIRRLVTDSLPPPPAPFLADAPPAVGAPPSGPPTPPLPPIPPSPPSPPAPPMPPSPVAAPARPPVPDAPPVPQVGDPEEMPRFPGCESVGDPAERASCAQQRFLSYIYQHLRYPEAAREQGLEGMAIIHFLVEPDGRVMEMSVLRDIGAGTGEAVLDVLRQMERDGIRWIPGRKKGQAIRAEMHLPVRFALPKE
jgi:TonB family protein